MELASRENLFLKPAHPYTLMLLAAFSHSPKLRDAWRVAETGVRQIQQEGLQLQQSLPHRSAGLQRASPAFRRVPAWPFRTLPFPGEPRMNAILTVENLFKQFPILGSNKSCKRSTTSAFQSNRAKRWG